MSLAVSCPSGASTASSCWTKPPPAWTRKTSAIQQALTSLTAAGSGQTKTVIVIAHRLSTIRHADQILVVKDGQIIQSGTHAELLGEEGTYKRFVEVRRQAESWSFA